MDIMCAVVFVFRYGRVPTLVWQESSGQTSR